MPRVISPTFVVNRWKYIRCLLPITRVTSARELCGRNPRLTMAFVHRDKALCMSRGVFWFEASYWGGGVEKGDLPISFSPCRKVRLCLSSLTPKPRSSRLLKFTIVRGLCRIRVCESLSIERSIEGFHCILTRQRIRQRHTLRVRARPFMSLAQMAK